MACPRSFAVTAGICPLLAVIDTMPLILLGCVTVLVALFMTWRPVPRSK